MEIIKTDKLAYAQDGENPQIIPMSKAADDMFTKLLEFFGGAVTTLSQIRTDDKWKSYFTKTVERFVLIDRSVQPSGKSVKIMEKELQTFFIAQLYEEYYRYCQQTNTKPDT